MRHGPGRWALSLAVGGCERYERVLGTIHSHGDPGAIELPDTVGRGVPFPIHVRTYLGGCAR